MTVGLGWKVLPGANTLAYHKNSLIMDEESFITLCQWDGYRTFTKLCSIISTANLRDGALPQKYVH